MKGNKQKKKLNESLTKRNAGIWESLQNRGVKEGIFIQPFRYETFDSWWDVKRRRIRRLQMVKIPKEKSPFTSLCHSMAFSLSVPGNKQPH